MTAGALAVSEIRGPQTGADTWGQWIEVYNTTAGSLDLTGLVINLKKLDGSDEVNIMVRDPDLSVFAGGRAVLGRFPREGLPSHADYGYAADFTGNLYADGILKLLSCGDLVDQVVYRNMPSSGTLSFDGSLALSAAANDNEAAWCVDDAEPAQPDPSSAGIPGTPREVNRPCN